MVPLRGYFWNLVWAFDPLQWTLLGAPALVGVLQPFSITMLSARLSFTDTLTIWVRCMLRAAECGLAAVWSPQATVGCLLTNSMGNNVLWSLFSPCDGKLTWGGVVSGQSKLRPWLCRWLAGLLQVTPLLILEQGWRICDSEGLLPNISEIFLKTECHFTPV